MGEALKETQRLQAEEQRQRKAAEEKEREAEKRVQEIDRKLMDATEELRVLEAAKSEAEERSGMESESSAFLRRQSDELKERREAEEQSGNAESRRDHPALDVVTNHAV